MSGREREMPDSNQRSLDSGAIRHELLSASDAEIEAAVRFSDPMSLRGLIYQLTGDPALLDVKVLKQRVFLAEAVVPATDAEIAFIQERAATFLKQYRDSGAHALDLGPIDRLPHSLALAAGEPIEAEELPMWIEETAIDKWARALVWPLTPDPNVLARFTVAVIGAGMGGLGAAVQLRKAGIPFFVIEKNDEVGGTWYENTYPGARVDTPSRAYTHIFGADFIFDSPFSPQSQNQAYFEWIADNHHVRDHTHFNTEVQSMTWMEDSGEWLIQTLGSDGPRSFRANGVICATGLLARPNIPDFDGEADFKGPIFHTARWPKDFDHAGKRIAVIGTGATGYQLIPELAQNAAHVVVVQRKPQWVFDVPGYLSPLPPEVTWLDRNLPYHINFLRFRTNWLTGEHVYGDVFNLDPDWNDARSRSALSHDIIEDRVAYIERKFADRPELVAPMTPAHPPFSSRPILVDAAYNIYDALLQDNVSLVTGGIDRVTSTGIVAAGQHYDVDVIVKATGFRANDMLWPMTIVGRGGQTVEDFWAKDGCRAYVSGSIMPGFPNLFVIYGPNTNPAQGGGIVNHEEMVTRFALECFAKLILDGKKSVDVQQAAFANYNRLLDEREKRKIYTDPRAQTYYMNRHQRSSIMCPFGPSELWRMLKHRPEDDLVFT